MDELILVKLGGSLITDKNKPYTARPETIRRISQEIREALNEKSIRLIVGHGGGSFPHQSAAKYETQKGLINEKSAKGIALVQNDAAKLNRIVVDALLEADVNAVSLQPSCSAIARGSRIRSWDMKPVEMLLELGMVPVPYGDVGLDEKQGCCILSTEEVISFLAKKLGAKRIILAGKTDGVLTDDGQLLSEITEKNFSQIKKHLKGSDGKDVTGGMVHKVERMLEFAKDGIKSEIINGNKAGYVKRAILGETGLGTRIF